MSNRHPILLIVGALLWLLVLAGPALAHGDEANVPLRSLFFPLFPSFPRSQLKPSLLGAQC